MPKEKTSIRALTGTRLLNLPVPTCSPKYTDGAGWGNGLNGWTSISGSAATGIYYENYFDLSGYELDDLTLVPTMMQLQDALPYTTDNIADPNLGLAVFDIISQERLNPATVAANYAVNEYPSSPGSKDDWTQILMCGFRLFLPQTDFTTTQVLLPAQGGPLGSSQATAVQKLWVYRIIITGASDWSNKSVFIPATRFVLGAEVIKEDDLEYMMRLKRSYELATQG